MREKRKPGYIRWIFAAVIGSMLCTPVFAGEQGMEGEPENLTENVSEVSDIGIYLIPQGAEGEEEGKFWLYAELLNSRGEAFTDSSLTVSLDVVNTQNGAENQIDLEMAEEIAGYMNNPVELVSESGCKDYELRIQAESQGTFLKEKTENAADCILHWPVPESEEWNETVKQSQDL